MKLNVAVLAALLVLAGCGGGGGGGQAVAPTGGSTNTQGKQSGKFVLSIPTGPSSSAKVRYPQFVSPNANSVTLYINTAFVQTFDVSATSALCTTVAGARNCTLSFVAPLGADSFSFTIYSGTNATGSVLASGTDTTTVVLGTPFNIAVGMNASVGTLMANVAVNNTPGQCPNSPNSFKGISEGCAGTASVTFTVADPSGATVTGTAPYASPINLTTSDPSLTMTPAQITAPGQSSTFAYSGAAFGAGVTNTVMVTANAGGQVASTTISVQRQYLYVANSNVVPGNTPGGGGTITVYTYGSGAGSTPVRTISGAATLLYDPIGVTLDSSDNLYVLDNGRYVGGQSHPEILIFAPGANGNVAPAKQIGSLNNAAVVTAPYTCETMVLNPAQTYLYVMCDDAGIGSGLIHVFPAGGNGAAAGLQTAEIGGDGWTQPLIGMAFDQTGNLYIADTQSNYIGYFPTNAQGSPTGGFQGTIDPTSVMRGGTSWPAAVSPIGLYIDQQGTLYSTIGYFSVTASAPSDASNELALWKTTSIPCTTCTPNVTLTGTPFTTHVPAGITLDALGNAYVSNEFTNTITVFSKASLTAGGANLTPLQTITVGTAPVGMVVGP